MEGINNEFEVKLSAAADKLGLAMQTINALSKRIPISPKMSQPSSPWVLLATTESPRSRS